MNVLFTGRGTSGSWQIRGEQIAAAMGAKAQPMAPRQAAHAVVGIKRLPDRLVTAHAYAPMLWDVVDAWPQPEGNAWGRSRCLEWLSGELARIKPAAVIAATDQMRKDVESLGVQAFWLRHHHRPKIKPNPIRAHIETVGYEGSAQYLSAALPGILRQTMAIGAKFVINPAHLADVDVVLAFRNSKGYAPRSWKSGVKLANAHGSGTPFIGCEEAGYLEIATGVEYWAEDEEGLGVALAWLADQSVREQISDRFRRAAYSVDDAARDLAAFLDSVVGKL